MRGDADPRSGATAELSPRPLDHFDLTLPAVPSAVPRIRQAFRRMAASVGLEEARLFPMAVALGEAVTNVIVHAYGAGHGTVRVAARVEGPQLIMEIEDYGQWREKPHYQPGHGLHIMRAFADAVEIDAHPAGTGTIIRLRANLPRAEKPVPVTAKAPGARRRQSLPARGAPERGPAGEGAGHGAAEAAPGTPLSFGGGQFAVRTVQSVPVIDVHADIDISNTGEFEAAAAHAAKIGHGIVLVSLGANGYIDSRGIQVLLQLAVRLAQNRRRLGIVAPTGGRLRRILEVAGVGAVAALFDSVAEAVPRPPVNI